MNLKDIFSKSKYYYRRSLSSSFPYIFAFFVIIFAILLLNSFAFENILGILVPVATLMVLIPILIGFKLIAFKNVNDIELDKKDLYIGFKFAGAVLPVQTNLILGPVLYFALGAIAGTTFSGAILFGVIAKNDPSIITMMFDGTDSEILSEAMAKLPYVDMLGFTVMTSILLFGLLAIGLFSLKYIYAPQVKFSSIFSPRSSLTYSKNFYNDHKQETIKINLLFLLIVFFTIIINYGILVLLNKTNLNIVYGYLLSSFISAIILTFSYYYYQIIISTTYKLYFKEEIEKKNKDLIEKLNKLNTK